jgi:hypothetical protein
MLFDVLGRYSKILITLFCVFLFPLDAYSGWSSTRGAVLNIYSHNGTVIIDTEITDGPCGNGKGFWWPITDDDSQVMLSLVLTALSSERQISVVYNPTTPECFANRAKITHLLLRGK